VRLAKSIIKGTLKGREIFVSFFGNLGSEVAWSCRGSNAGPSDSQPDAMALCHCDPFIPFYFDTVVFMQ